MRKVLGYAVSYAPKGQKGGPYEYETGNPGDTCSSLHSAMKWPIGFAHQWLEDNHITNARVIRIVQKDENPDMDRLRIVGKNLCGLLMDMRVASRDDIADRVTFALKEINKILPTGSKVSVPKVDPVSSPEKPPPRRRS